VGVRALLFAVALSACAVRAPSPDRERASCEACLAQGKTWQGAAGCTTSCAVQDTSCYRDHCPGPCASSACGDCRAQDACVRAGCTWEVAGEAMWCR
jgi:hypothetical protein